jgi:hypothetical protein
VAAAAAEFDCVKVAVPGQGQAVWALGGPDERTVRHRALALWTELHPRRQVEAAWTEPELVEEDAVPMPEAVEADALGIALWEKLWGREGMGHAWAYAAVLVDQLLEIPLSQVPADLGGSGKGLVVALDRVLGSGFALVWQRLVPGGPFLPAPTFLPERFHSPRRVPAA